MKKAIKQYCSKCGIQLNFDAFEIKHQDWSKEKLLAEWTSQYHICFNCYADMIIRKKNQGILSREELVQAKSYARESEELLHLTIAHKLKDFILKGIISVKEIDGKQFFELSEKGRKLLKKLEEKVKK